MNDRDKTKTGDRHERLRSALRENLRRRKAQAKSRAAERKGETAPQSSAGIAGDKAKG